MRQLAALLVMALPFAISWLAAGRLLGGRARLLQLALACAGAMAIGGVLFSVALYLFPSRASEIDLAVELALLTLLLRKTPTMPPAPRPRPVVLWATASVAVVALLYFAVDSELLPHGAWDAWAIWNLKARLFARAPGEWRLVFDPALNYSHPDYPLLLPASIARTWRLVGGEPPFVPRLQGLLFAVAAALFVAAAVARERGVEPACAAVCFLCLGPLPTYAARQYADVPVSCFAVGAVALLLYQQPLLAGVFAGLAAWTKNEGLLVLLVITAVTLLRQRRDLGRLLIGATPFVALQLWHKHLAPVDDYRQWWTVSGALRDLVTGSRLRTTAVAFAKVSWRLWWPLSLPLAVALLRRRPSPSLRPVLLMFLLMYAGYFLVMTTTPLPLEYHLSTTADRLLMQIHPLLVLALFLALPSGGRWESATPTG